MKKPFLCLIIFMANVWGCRKRKSGVTISLQNSRKWHFYGSCRKQSKKVGNKEGKHFVCHKNMIFCQLVLWGHNVQAKLNYIIYSNCRARWECLKFPPSTVDLKFFNVANIVLKRWNWLTFLCTT